MAPQQSKLPSQLREESQTKALAAIESLALPEGTALVATGSLARGEMTPYSDIDLLLIHGQTAPPDEELERLWYPLWDAGFRVDYALRTPADCANLLNANSTSALAMLEMRHVRGDEGLSQQAREKTLKQWRREIARNFEALVDTAIMRWRRSGSVVTMTHPDLKNGRGGLRDLELLGALALANLCDIPPLNAEKKLLLDTRVLLHADARRHRDVLDPEFAAAVAEPLGFNDRYELSAALAHAARDIDEALTAAMAASRALLGRKKILRRAPRMPVDKDVVEAAGELTLAKNVDLLDPSLLLRVAAAAARTGLPIEQNVWEQLKKLPPMPEDRWPRNAVEDFFSLLSAPEHLVEIIRVLDRQGLWGQLIPGWDHIRDRLPRERTHIHTIDQHLVNCVALCAEARLRGPVARPDLLSLAALFHDIGKGYDRPHEQVGAEYAARMAQVLGLNPRASRCVQTLVAEHTTIARLAARCDPYDDEPVDRLLDAVHYDLLILDLLEVLAEADAKATGPGVWSARLENATRVLCSRARTQLRTLHPMPPMVAAPREIELRQQDDRDTVHWAGNDTQEVLAVIAAKAWSITGARINADGGQFAGEFDVRSTTGTPPDAVEFAQAYSSRVHVRPPKVQPAPTATYWHGNVLDIRTVDRPGALANLIAALPQLRWLVMKKRGSTLITTCRLESHPDRAAVERAVRERLT